MGSAAPQNQPSPIQPSPVQPSLAQPSPAQPSQPSQAQPQGSPIGVGLAKAPPKAFLLLDSDGPFSAPQRHRFWYVFGPFGAAVPLRFPVLRGWLWGFLLGLPEVRSRRVPGLPTLTPAQATQPSPSLGVGPAQAKPSPGQLAQSRPGQLAQSRPGQPKPCLGKGFVLPDSEVPFSAARTLRFWSVWGRRAAAFPCFEEVALGPRFGSPSPVLKGRAQALVWAQPSPSPAQASPPSPGQASLSLALAKALFYWMQRSRSPPRERSVFGLFGAAVPLRFPVLRGWLWGLVLGLPQVRSRRVPGLPTLTPAQPTPQPSPAQAQPRPASPSPAAWPAQPPKTSPAQFSPAQFSPA